MAGPANKALVEAMHNALAEVLLKAVKEGTPLLLPSGAPVLDENNKPIIGPAPAAVLNQVRQFLKDNDVKAIPVKGSALDQLGRAAGNVTLPFEGDPPTVQ